MDSQATLWLYPLILLAIFELVFYGRLGLRWTWGLCLQALAMLMVAAGGLVTGHHVTGALAGWTLFVIFVLVPKSMIARLERSLNILDADTAIAIARQLRWFFWGLPGSYWLELTQAMKCFLVGDFEKAEALIQHWQSMPLPRQARESLALHIMTGRVFARDWQGITADLAQVVQQKGKVSLSMAASACRAYLELGKPEEATRCLELGENYSARISDASRELSFVAFFGLTGAEPELESVFTALARTKHRLPDYSRLYWLSRCLVAQGRIEDARQLLARAMACVPAKSSVWRERILFQLEHLLGAPDAVPTPDYTQYIGRGRKILEHCRLVSDITAPKRSCYATTVITTVIIAVYLLSHSFEFLPYSLAVKLGVPQLYWQAVDLGNYCLQYGALYKPAVEHGQWWRPITFLFLHAHVSHVALNLVALWWFGRICENLFGTSRFLIIFFASGILSGVSEVCLSKSMMAIGASGSVMGLFGATTAAVFRLKQTLPKRLRKTELTWMFGLALTQVILDEIIPNVAIFAHLGGLVSGFLLGLILPIKKQFLSERAKSEPRELKDESPTPSN
jgi:membrane associated rhomboid family serine protease